MSLTFPPRNGDEVNELPSSVEQSARSDEISIFIIVDTIRPNWSPGIVAKCTCRLNFDIVFLTYPGYWTLPYNALSVTSPACVYIGVSLSNCKCEFRQSVVKVTVT